MFLNSSGSMLGSHYPSQNPRPDALTDAPDMTWYPKGCTKWLFMMKAKVFLSPKELDPSPKPYEAQTPKKLSPFKLVSWNWNAGSIQKNLQRRLHTKAPEKVKNGDSRLRREPAHLSSEQSRRSSSWWRPSSLCPSLSSQKSSRSGLSSSLRSFFHFVIC